MALVPARIKRSEKHLIKPILPARADARTKELQTAKQILAEVFHVRPSDVEDMIMRRLAEKIALEQGESVCIDEGWQDGESRVSFGPWPEMFWIER